MVARVIWVVARFCVVSMVFNVDFYCVLRGC